MNGDPAFPTRQVQPSRDMTLSDPEWPRHARPSKSLAVGAVAAFLILLSTLTASASDWSEALHKCRPAGLQEEILCGKLLIPENWVQPDGRKITLDIEIIPSLDSRKSDRAFFDLAGGPGLPATGSAGLYMDILRDYQGNDPNSPNCATRMVRSWLCACVFYDRSHLLNWLKKNELS